MTRTRARRPLLALAVLVAGGTAAALWPRGPRPDWDAVQAVTTGMTRDEVAAAVGVPPGVYGRGWGPGPPSLVGYHDGPWEHWAFDGGVLSVAYGPTGRAEVVLRNKDFSPPRPGVLRRLAAWLGL